MKPFVWYMQEIKDDRTGKMHTMYGMLTGTPVHYCIYLAPTPWSETENWIGFSNFKDTKKFEPALLDDYLWDLLIHSKTARYSIYHIFGDDYPPEQE
jgi:hypothetical protein